MKFRFVIILFSILLLSSGCQTIKNKSSSFFGSFLSKIFKNSAIKAIIFRLETFYEVIKNMYEFNSSKD